MDEDTRSKVLEKMTTERDLRNQMAYAKQMAIEEGLAEGRAEGRAEGIIAGERAKAIEIAVKLTATGMSRAEAAAFVGISEADMEAAM